MAYRPNASSRGGPSASMYAEENQRLETDLSDKVNLLKSISINIGTEVKHQNKMLNEMGDDSNSLTNMLQGSMSRLTKLAKRGNCKSWFIIAGFIFATLTVMYFILRLR